MPAFKTDESFLEKISIGAIGTRKVFENLKSHQHNPIELERGSMNYKIWKKIKIKRIRVPDILCVHCGTRIESRAKTDLQISMSHSFSDPDRGWDFGLNDSDYVALVVCRKVGDRPIDWLADNLVQYVSVRDMRKAVQRKQVYYIKPKGAQEGFEARISWPAAVASAEGSIKKISENSIQFSRAKDERSITLRLTQKEIQMSPLTQVGQGILENQIIASVIPVLQSFPFQAVTDTYYLDNLSSTNLSERYGASKALSFFNNQSVRNALIQKLQDTNEHIYVRLEAAASLARLGNQQGYDFISSCFKDTYLQNVLEAVIVLAEVKTELSCKMLSQVLDDISFDAEIRAGAAWGLGELNNKIALDSLVASFALVDESIRVEATRALAKLTTDFSPDIVNQFKKSSPQNKAGIAWALTKSPTLRLDDLLVSLTDEDSRQWISYIIGVQGQERYIAEIERLKNQDPQVYFAVTVLWKIMTSWIYNLNEY